MQFLSSRSVSFGIMLGGQHMVVMFSERNDNGLSSFVTLNEDIAQAIRRHSYFKKGIVWELTESDGVETPTNEDASGATSRTEQYNETTTQIAEVPEGEKQAFGNFSEAKEWFCKKYGVAKSSVKNPTALMAEANARGVEIVIGG